MLKAAAFLPLLLAACSGAPDKKPSAPQTPALKPCGVEVNKRNTGYDAAARECIWQSYKSREPAEFTTTRYTIEGDPITYRIEIAPLGVVVVVDSRDRYGHKGVFRHTCRNFERIMQDGSKERFGFALSGCSGSGTERLAVP
jgi:hypothetical protein